MNTNHLKKFAKSARKLLLEDVSKRLLYWGIDSDGEVVHELTRTSGGYLFRGEVYNDQSVPDKWNNLISAIKQHSIEDVIEEAAYTWFNRLIAIKILEKNRYDPEVLAYVSGELSDPILLQNAKKGIFSSSDPAIVAELKQAILKSNDDELFSMLLIHHCRSHHLLNNIFGHINDYTELLIPQTLLVQGGLLELLNSDENISDEEYGEVELIGWLYQFYISDKKDEVFAGFKKKKKARVEDIPAATQIFTPKWIVKYLVENTVGRIWLDLHPESPIRETMKYLVEPENDTPDDPIIKDVTELKVLDPAVGSGHFLVVAFDLLMQMYQEEGYSKRKAVESIIKQNLYGLDICPRAAGLANFAILLKAAQYNTDILHNTHYPMVYAMPEPFDFTHNQVEIFLGSSRTEHVDGIHSAFKTLKQGQNIGSALILNLSDETRAVLQNSRRKCIEDVIDLSDQMTFRKILPFAQVASILTDHFPAVVANPPYMGNQSMNSELSDYLKGQYPNSKADLFAVFMEVLPNRTLKEGYFGLINLPSWLFLGTYEKIRQEYISKYFIRNMLHFGRGIFGIDWGSVALTVRKIGSGNRTGEYFKLHERTFQHIHLRDIERLFQYALKNPDYKYDFKQYRDEEGVNEIPVQSNATGKNIFYPAVTQSDFSKIPGSPIAYWASERVVALFEHEKSLKELAPPRVGLQTGENILFVRQWNEISFNKVGLDLNRDKAMSSGKKWFPHNNGGSFRKWYGNNNDLVDWEHDGIRIKNDKLYKLSVGKCLLSNSKPKNMQFYFKESITWSKVSSTSFGVRYSPEGKLFDTAGSSVFANGSRILYLTGLLNTKLTHIFLNVLNPTLNFQAGNIAKIPTRLNVEQQPLINSIVSECISIAKKDWDSRETSWDFQKSPLLNESSSIYQSFLSWCKLAIQDFLQLHEYEEELNRKFIDIYGLQKELSPNVALQDITILQEELKGELIKNMHEDLTSTKTGLLINRGVVIHQLLSYAAGCLLGRYRLDKPGLSIAHPNPTDEELSMYEYNGYDFKIDDDAIIPIMGSESPFSDDILQRIKQFVLIVWGEDSYTENLNFINGALGEDLEKYLSKKFWNYHKKMYKNRPIYWQFASPKGAFKVITYMHRMNRFTVQIIRKNYLFKQMIWLDSEIATLVENEATLQTKESKRLDKLRKDLIECREYDLLLKDMADRQIEFDLDDGVVENYKLFEGVVSKI